MDWVREVKIQGKDVAVPEGFNFSEAGVDDGFIKVHFYRRETETVISHYYLPNGVLVAEVRSEYAKG